jgi:hypothetical protein
MSYELAILLRRTGLMTEIYGEFQDFLAGPANPQQNASPAAQFRPACGCASGATAAITIFRPQRSS